MPKHIHIDSQVIPLTRLQMLFAMRRIHPDYNDAIHALRRSNDNAEDEFKLDDNGLFSLSSPNVAGTTTLGTWVGSNSAFSRRWYSQVNNLFLEQPTPNYQPRLVNNGVLDTAGGLPAVHFAGSFRYYEELVTTYKLGLMNIVCDGAIANGSPSFNIIGSPFGTVGIQSFMSFGNTTGGIPNESFSVLQATTGALNNVIYSVGGLAANQRLSLSFSRSSILYNGVVQPLSPPGARLNYDDDIKLTLGKRSGINQFFTGNIHQVLLYDLVPDSIAKLEFYNQKNWQI